MTYGYIRVSTEKQTVENQRFEILRFAQQPQINNEMFSEYADRLSKAFQIGCGLGENSYGNYAYGMRSADGKTWYWYNVNSAASQNNESEITYFWFSIG